MNIDRVGFEDGSDLCRKCRHHQIECHYKYVFRYFAVWDCFQYLQSGLIWTYKRYILEFSKLLFIITKIFSKIEKIQLINLDFLEKNGWCIINTPSMDLDCIPNLLIKKFQLDFKIKSSFIHPKSSTNDLKGKYSTFSSIYGFDSFPLHTDTAFRKVPTRFLIMKSLHHSSTATVFFNFIDFYNNLSEKYKTYFNNAIFSIKSTDGSYYNSLFLDKDKKFIRFDPLLMIPQNIAANHCLKILCEQQNEKKNLLKISWDGANILIIDNWKILHGREKVVELEYNFRKIKRIYVG